jgi:hypothetical protein
VRACACACACVRACARACVWVVSVLVTALVQLELQQHRRRGSQGACPGAAGQHHSHRAEVSACVRACARVCVSSLGSSRNSTVAAWGSTASAPREPGRLPRRCRATPLSQSWSKWAVCLLLPGHADSLRSSLGGNRIGDEGARALSLVLRGNITLIELRYCQKSCFSIGLGR